jgi:hypothetical protein
MPNPRTEPWRAPLAALRSALLHLHKQLLDAERLRYETEHGPIKSNGEYLQLLIHNPRFTWLQPFTALIVGIDETEDSKEPVTESTIAGHWEQAALLLKEEQGEAPFTRLIASVPAVQVAHAELRVLLTQRSASAH